MLITLTRDFPRCVEKLKNLYNEWRNLQKHATRQNENQKIKEQQFTEKFMRKIKKKEERQEKLNARKKRHYEECTATFNKRKFNFFIYTFIFNFHKLLIL